MSNFSFKTFFVLSILSAVSFPLFAYAQYYSPSITSYKSSVSSMNSGQIVTFSWTMSNAGGYSFVIPCLSGIKLKNGDGTQLNCDSPISNIFTTNDAIAVIVNNVSGSTKNIIGRLIPKDTGGVAYTNGTQEIAVSVATLPQPITSFTASETDTTSGKSITISWTSDFLDGVNLQIECRGEITVSSPNYTDASVMPCAKIIFLSDLSPSGSLSLSFTNSSNQPIPYTVKLYPAVIPRTSYDGTHALTLTLNVASDTLPDPVVNYFTASTTAVMSRDKVIFVWGTTYGVGVNIKFSCSPFILVGNLDTTQLFPCDAYVFDSPLSPTDQMTFSFNNSDSQDHGVIITLVPSKKVGTYDATRGKSIALTVHPFGATPAPAPSVTSSPTPVATPTPSGSPSSLLLKTVFIQFLKRGSRGEQVSTLQGFLKHDANLYPEGLVTGFFGAATERAVQRFQSKYGIATSGTSVTTGYGAVGPRTRNKLNELQ